MSAVIDHGHAHGPYGGLMRWITTTNHKDIGTLYLWFSFTMFLVGGMLALAIRAELFRPGLQFWHPEFFNQLTTMHGLIMVFGAIMPAFVGFANWQVPMMIGAPDMAFARLNNWSFWLLPVAAMLLVGSFFVPGGAAAGGWTSYPTLSVQAISNNHWGKVFWILAVAIEARAAKLAAEHGFEGRMQFLPDPKLRDADCRIEWRGGGLECSHQAIDAALADLISHRFTAPALSEVKE